MTLTPATFISDAVIFLRNYLRTNMSSVSVMTSFPKTNTTYPLVTIKLTNAPTYKLGIQSEANWVTMNIEGRVWAKNAKDCDTYTQQMIDTLRQAQLGAGGTTEYELFDFKVNSINSIVEDEGDNSVHSKVCSFRYSAILT